jgi:hypothetical protein
MPPDDGVWPDDGAGADRRLRVHDSTGVDGDALPPALAGGVAGQPHQQHGLGGDVLADVRARVRARQPLTPLPDRHLQPQAIAGNDRQPELGVVDATEVRVSGRSAVARWMGQQNGRDLRERLYHEDARHQRSTGKMTLEELFVHRDVLDRHDPPAGLMFHDRIDER